MSESTILTKELQKAKPDVVAMLPYVGNKVLLQLRDEKPNIVFPGKWGFFSGSIEPGELPESAARRELSEELEYTPSQLIKLSTEFMMEEGRLSHVYYCPLEVPVEKIILHEGMDFGLFSWEEIVSKKLYSPKMRKSYPVIDTPFVFTMIQRVLEKISSRNVHLKKVDP